MKPRYIYNLEQAYFYIQNGIKPIDIPKEHYRTKKIYFTFSEEQTRDVYDKWCKLCESNKSLGK